MDLKSGQRLTSHLSQGQAGFPKLNHLGSGGNCAIRTLELEAICKYKSFLKAYIAPMSKCKKCGSHIYWRNDGRQWQCFNPDGSVHWDLCSKLCFEQVRSSGRLVIDGQDKGYTSTVKAGGVQWFELHARVRTGEHYHPSSDCAECCEPWEVCAFPCPDAIGGQH